VKELVVISGKGGTGKTSLVASFAALAKDKVLADCDVDAADLHLVLEPKIQERHSFSGGNGARILPGHCIACGKCEEVCQFEAIYFDGPGNGLIEKTFRIDPFACEGCGVCAHFCDYGAIEFKPEINGEWFISDSRHGPMVHARLGVAQENSGKLVALIREQARKIAEQRGLDLVIIDGSPGIGCPVIASITGATVALAVSEPTQSGMHDLGRVAELTSHFNIPLAVCINKFDINPEVTGEIEAFCESRGIRVVGRIPYDPAVTKAQIARASVVEYSGAPVSMAMRKVWRETQYCLG
jgi:MinD superfamily P-loop ATPase